MSTNARERYISLPTQLRKHSPGSLCLYLIYFFMIVYACVMYMAIVAYCSESNNSLVKVCMRAGSWEERKWDHWPLQPISLVFKQQHESQVCFWSPAQNVNCNLSYLYKDLSESGLPHFCDGFSLWPLSDHLFVVSMGLPYNLVLFGLAYLIQRGPCTWELKSACKGISFISWYP